MGNDTSPPERIWARVSPDWHDDETGEDFVGGIFDAGHYRDGTPYVRADLYDAALTRAEEAGAEVERLSKVLEAIQGVGFDAPNTWSGTEAGWERHRANTMRRLAIDGLQNPEASDD